MGSYMNNPAYKISIFVFPGKHKVPKVHRMSVRHIHTILTIQSKVDLPDQLSQVPEQIFLFVISSVFLGVIGTCRDNEIRPKDPWFE